MGYKPKGLSIVKGYICQVSTCGTPTPTPPVLQQISDPSYELTQTSPLAISPKQFQSKLKTLLFSKSYPD